jgi:hypothetical protein
MFRAWSIASRVRFDAFFLFLSSKEEERVSWQDILTRGNPAVRPYDSPISNEVASIFIGAEF